MSIYTFTKRPPRQRYNYDLEVNIYEQQILVYEKEKEPVDTGLVDEYDNMIFRMPEENPIGFLWDIHEKS